MADLKYRDILFKPDCRLFLADRPCKYHKSHGQRCPDCTHYEAVDKRILIIKLGATGDVIRTTPVLTKLKELYPHCEITWITNFPEVVPKIVDHVLKLGINSFLRLSADKFDILINLDKDKEACSLAMLIKADIKKGFALERGKCVPIDKDAKVKFFTGLDDALNKGNNKSYVEEIFEISGLNYSKGKYDYLKEEYVVDIPDIKIDIPKLTHPLIGLNTGCSKRWPTREWPEKNWVELSKQLLKKGHGVILLGGSEEHEKNLAIAKQSGAYYYGIVPLDQFIHLVNLCDTVVTAVTMAMHFSIALKKRLVLFNNIFNKNEFELYGRGVIIQPKLDCLGCFKQKFDDRCPADNCMELIKVEDVLRLVEDSIKGGVKSPEK